MPSSHGVSAAPHGPDNPFAVEDVVPGKVIVRIFSHVISSYAGAVPSWTYLSDGLLAEGQEEISFTVKREPGEVEGSYPRVLLDLYATIHEYAAQKQFVHEGGTTRLNPHGPRLVGDGFHGVMYTPGQPLAGVTAPGSFLTAVIITGSELDVAENFGVVRMMSLIGKKYRFFPTAPWLDRRRAEIVRLEAMTSSILAIASRYRLGGAWVRLDAGPDGARTWGGQGAKVVLTLTRAAGRRFVEGLKDLGTDIGLAVLLDLDPEADGIFVWEPGQTTPSAILRQGAAGTRLAGNHLLISNASDLDGASALEDGFGLLLTPETWATLRSALEEGRPVEVRGSGHLVDFALAWADEELTNPHAVNVDQ